jgi:hypothetical protein
MPTRHFVRHGCALIADAWPRAQTRAGRECRSRGLQHKHRLAGGWPAGGAASRGKQRKGKRTRALDVADDGAGLVVHELDTALGDTTTGACIPSAFVPSLAFSCFCGLSSPASSAGSRTGTAKDTGDLDELDGGLSGFHFVRLLGSTKGGRAVCGFARRMGCRGREGAVWKMAVRERNSLSEAWFVHTSLSDVAWRHLCLYIPPFSLCIYM